MRTLLLAAALLAATPAAAVHYLVDTGAGSDFPHAPYLYNGGGLNYQFEAVQFYVPTATTIRSIEATLAPRVVDTTLTLRLYTVDPVTDAPQAGSAFFAQAFAVHDYYTGFQGIGGLSVAVTPGYYYAAFEVDAGQTFNGYFAAGAPRPQTSAYAYGFQQGGAYQRIIFPAESASLGLRIADSTVPEPAAWSLLIVGFAAVGAALRRRAARVLGVN
ncbi:MAG: PEPxxWA-CTERM sorting domain-containing protein [Sphingomonadaceae bacterium]|nr:PEPxxWA-CTERM sorting domain-containing protein [Sphingomonadaceae bacterium]